jgi:hypothetical protein
MGRIVSLKFVARHDPVHFNPKKMRQGMPKPGESVEHYA